jgi:hypothetical protein
MATKKAPPSENRQKPGKRPAPKTAFKPGKSGNPGGRPKLPEDVKHVRELARQYTAQAVAALVEVLESDSASAKVAAANALIDRGWGKAEQPITGPEGGPLQHAHKHELSDDALTAIAAQAK